MLERNRLVFLLAKCNNSALISKSTFGDFEVFTPQFVSAKFSANLARLSTLYSSLFVYLRSYIIWLSFIIFRLSLSGIGRRSPLNFAIQFSIARISSLFPNFIWPVSLWSTRLSSSSSRSRFSYSPPASPGITSDGPLIQISIEPYCSRYR